MNLKKLKKKLLEKKKGGEKLAMSNPYLLAYLNQYQQQQMMAQNMAMMQAQNYNQYNRYNSAAPSPSADTSRLESVESNVNKMGGQINNLESAVSHNAQQASRDIQAARDAMAEQMQAQQERREQLVRVEEERLQREERERQLAQQQAEVRARRRESRARQRREALLQLERMRSWSLSFSTQLNVLVSGMEGAGKTTLINALAGLFRGRPANVLPGGAQELGDLRRSVLAYPLHDFEATDAQALEPCGWAYDGSGAAACAVETAWTCVFARGERECCGAFREMTHAALFLAPASCVHIPAARSAFARFRAVCDAHSLLPLLVLTRADQFCADPLVLPADRRAQALRRRAARWFTHPLPQVFLLGWADRPWVRGDKDTADEAPEHVIPLVRLLGATLRAAETTVLRRAAAFAAAPQSASISPPQGTFLYYFFYF